MVLLMTYLFFLLFPSCDKVKHIQLIGFKYYLMCKLVLEYVVT